MTVTISAGPGNELVVEDRVEQRRLRLDTDVAVSPAAAAHDAIPYPVEAAATVTLGRFSIADALTVYLRDCNGDIVAEVDSFAERTFPDDAYLVEISGPVKLYVAVDGPLTVSLDSGRVAVELPEPQTVTVGARSYHQRPAATVTTTGDPATLMKAISTLSSSLKTLGPERSFPTLRDHPPELELDQELSIPDRLEIPDAGIHVEVPEELGPVFVVAPLAFYLGATVRRGPEPRIVTEAGGQYRLEGAYGFEREVQRVLKQTFLLDCLTRTGRVYDVALHERQIAEDRLSLDFSALYEASPADRLEQYLAIPYEEIADLVPRWKLTAHVTPEPDNIETLPFLVDDLAAIRTPVDREAKAHETHLAAINEFTRGSDESLGGETLDPSLIQPERTDSIEQAWVGPGVPLGASKTIPQAFRNRLARDETDSDLDIVVVVNDSEMREEGETARDVYGSRDELPSEVTIKERLSTSELAGILRSDVDYFHYVGHIDADGIRCADGMLDVRELESVAVDTFFLNACTSYRQGKALIKQGAVGGVVTLDDVIDSGAVRVGKIMSRLLTRGFPLRAALSIAAERSIIGNQYIVVGDGNMDIAHAESLSPNLLDVSRSGEDSYTVDYRTFYTGQGPGGIKIPYIADNSEYYLFGSELATFEVTHEELSAFLDLEVVPVRIGDDLFWSDELDLASLPTMDRS